jgi:hypothetical protein
MAEIDTRTSRRRIESDTTDLIVSVEVQRRLARSLNSIKVRRASQVKEQMTGTRLKETIPHDVAEQRLEVRSFNQPLACRRT